MGKDNIVTANFSEATLFTGIYFNFPLVIEIPCGNVVRIESAESFPRDNVMCPCGRPNHVAIMVKPFAEGQRGNE